MFIALVDFHVAPDAREAALAVLASEAPNVRALPGCRTFRPHLDPTGASLVGVVHEWDSAGAFAVYLASSGFASAGAVLRPMMTAPPSSRRYHADLVEDAGAGVD